MIIGLTGYKGSGKDITASILTSLLTKSSYETVCFANTLKHIVCVLIGCTREELEDREFKEKSLGEEWWVYKVGDHRLDTYPVYNHIVKSYTLNSIDELHRDWLEVHLVKTTPRILMQLLGTECGRNIIHPNIWVNSLFSKYKKTEKFDYPNWIITDVRFPNEVKAIRERGGIIVKIDRDLEKTDDHVSEKGIDEVDYVINNNGTINDLITEVKKFLNEYYKQINHLDSPL